MGVKEDALRDGDPEGPRDLRRKPRAHPYSNGSLSKGAANGDSRSQKPLAGHRRALGAPLWPWCRCLKSEQRAATLSQLFLLWTRLSLLLCPPCSLGQDQRFSPGLPRPLKDVGLSLTGHSFDSSWLAARKPTHTIGSCFLHILQRARVSF